MKRHEKNIYKYNIKQPTSNCVRQEAAANYGFVEGGGVKYCVEEQKTR